MCLSGAVVRVVYFELLVHVLFCYTMSVVSAGGIDCLERLVSEMAEQLAEEWNVKSSFFIFRQMIDRNSERAPS